MQQLIYKSNLGEIKTLGQWINFADLHGAIFAISSEDATIKLVTGPTIQEKVLRVLTEWKFFNKKPQQRTGASRYRKSKFHRNNQEVKP